MRQNIIPSSYPIGANIKALREYLNMTQKEFADSTNVSKASVHGYERNITLPPTGYLLMLRERYSLDLNQFVSTQFEPQEISRILENPEDGGWVQQNLKKFEGVYALYYFGTNTQGDQHVAAREEVVHQGVLIILPHSETSLRAMAVFNISRLRQAELFQELSAILESEIDAAAKLNGSRTLLVRTGSTSYEGFVTFTQDNMFVNLSCRDLDRVLIILRNRQSAKAAYIGGLGTMNSVTRGSTRDPCMQLVGLSSCCLQISNEELERNLLTRPFRPDMHMEMSELAAVIQALYTDQSELGKFLREKQKMAIIESLMEGYVRQAVQANEFRLGKVVNEQDNEWYHMIKEYGV